MRSQVVTTGSTPGRIRTCDLLIRSQLLYPAELPGQFLEGLDENDQAIPSHPNTNYPDRALVSLTAVTVNPLKDGDHLLNLL